MITDEHIDFSLASAISHCFVYQVCPIKRDKTVGGLGNEEEEEGRGMSGVELPSKTREKEG